MQSALFTLSAVFLALLSFGQTPQVQPNNGLIAFVGEKIDVQLLPYKPGEFDNGFRAKYKVLQLVYGHYLKDTIEFTAYDHYGWPAFSKYKNVLLFVSEIEGALYHQKYQYFDVYKTKDGRWASSYHSADYRHPYNKYTTIKPQPIDFEERVAYPTTVQYEDGTADTLNYPTPYFTIQGDTAFAVYGNYVEELFALKKNGVLKARGLFGPVPEEEIIVHDVELEDIKGPPNRDDLKFMAFWKQFAKLIRNSDLAKIKSIGLDTLWICGNSMATSNIDDTYLRQAIGDKVLNILTDINLVQYSWAEADLASLPSQAKKMIIKVKKIYRFREVVIKDGMGQDASTLLTFDFIETKKGYRLYGISRCHNAEIPSN